jgi:glycosyltransferase involved in cell wall biosynthesis
MPRISVIIPTHNRPQMLKEAVDSALGQTFQDFEIIIVLNGASPAAVEMADRLRASPKVKVVEIPDDTLAAARNFGLGVAGGEWIAFLDDDDVWLPDKLAIQLDAAERSGADIVTCNFSWFNDTGDLAGAGLGAPPQGLSLAEALMLQNCVSGGSAVIVKADAVRKLGGFDSSMRGCEDWDMWRRLAWDSKIHCVDRALVKYRRHGTNMTANLDLALQAETQHFAKLLRDTPVKLHHMMPAAKQRYFRFLLHNLTEQGAIDRYDVLFYNLFFSVYRVANRITGGASRKLYRVARAWAKRPFRRHRFGG